MLLESEEINRLVDEYLESMPDDEVLAIIGEGSFSSDELRDHVHRQTPVGERFVQMVLDGSLNQKALAKGV